MIFPIIVYKIKAKISEYKTDRSFSLIQITIIKKNRNINQCFVCKAISVTNFVLTGHSDQAAASYVSAVSDRTIATPYREDVFAIPVIPGRCATKVGQD